MAKKRNGGVFKGGLIPQCVLCVRPVKKKETPGHYLLHFSKYEKEREVLFKTIKESYKKKKQPIHPDLNNGRCARRTKLYA